MIVYDVFVTVGNDRRDFSRLFRLLNELDDLNGLRCLVQTGYSSVEDIPKHFTQVEFLSREEFTRYLSSSTVVICHAGAGTLLSCLQAGKKPYVLPRLKRLAEHIDDHQLDIYNEFLDQGWCYSFDGQLRFNDTIGVKVHFDDNEMASDIISLGWI